jgi:hypothetical protein
MLGIYSGSTSSGGTHIREMAKKGFIWADQIKSRPLPPDLAWKSLAHQLQPGMMWGIATVVMSPHRLLKQFQRVYFRCLPLLNVNCHIDLPWRLIPEQYQGLGMANHVLVSLASKLIFLQFNWGFESPHSSALMMAYKSFMIEVGLYGNIMDYDYKTHSMLATSGSWFKNIWELVWYFNVRVHVSAAFRLRAVRQGDISLMSEFMRTGNLSQPDLIFLNIMRMHKKVIHKLDIVLCDGKRIKVEILTDQPGQSGVHKFPTQHPTPADLNLWKLALCKLSSDLHVCSRSSYKNISVPRITSPGGCLTILELFFIIILCEVIRCTTRSIHHLQIQSIAEPGWDNVSTLQL